MAAMKSRLQRPLLRIGSGSSGATGRKSKHPSSARANYSVGIMATRRLHGHGLLPDLLAQRGQPSALVAQPEQSEQEASRQQNDSREHGEQENQHQLPPPRRKLPPVEFTSRQPRQAGGAAVPPGNTCSSLEI